MCNLFEYWPYASKSVHFFDKWFQMFIFSNVYFNKWHKHVISIFFYFLEKGRASKHAHSACEEASLLLKKLNFILSSLFLLVWLRCLRWFSNFSAKFKSSYFCRVKPPSVRSDPFLHDNTHTSTHCMLSICVFVSFN